MIFGLQCNLNTHLLTILDDEEDDTGEDPRTKLTFRYTCGTTAGS
jgi:hypothetical protein